MKIACMIFGFILLSGSSNAQQSKSAKLENLYNEIPHYENRPEYWLSVHSNDCSYIAKVNDMPVYTNFNEGNLQSVSFPINTLLLRSGKHILNFTLLPKTDSNFGLAATLSKEYAIKVKIVKIENKKETIVLEKNYVADDGGNLPLKEYNLSFDVEVPYQLSGWQDGIDLKQEDLNLLEQEVVGFYNDITNDYEIKNFESLEEKYYTRQLENAECLYQDGPEDSKKLVKELKNDLNKKQDFTLEHFKLQFYGNGKVVALIRTDGEFRGKSALLGLTDEDYYIYSLLLYRRKSDGPIEVIR